jgi:hypothetical protein
VGAAAVTGVAAATSTWGLLAPAAALAGVAAVFTTVQVQAGPAGLDVRLAGGRLPARRIPLGEIESVEAAEIHPLAWGGWGWRWMPHRTAIVVRGGPGLVVRLRGGGRFAVTVDAPEGAVAALAAARRGPVAAG